MFKTIILILALNIAVFANNVEVLKNDFLTSLSQKDRQAVEYLIDKDEFYGKAIDYLTNPAKMAKKEITAGDPEKPKELKKRVVALPDYINALLYFKQSVYNFKNPLSAYIALNIMKTKIPARSMEQLKTKRKYTEEVFKYVKTCSAYIDYANVYANGIAGSPDIKKALEVLEEAKKSCFSRSTDWERAVIDMKISKYKMKLGL